MKTKNDTQNATQSQEEALLREKAHHYLVCFSESCPLRDDCLRWMVGQYVDPNVPAWTAVNPRNPKVGGEQCEMFRKKQRVMMKSGLTRMYDDMPGRVEYNVRHLLIRMWGRRQYFEYRRGDRLLDPDRQKDVAYACRQCGWQGPIVYDGEEESWLW